MRRTVLVTFVLALSVVFSDVVKACPSCYGDSSSSEVIGMQWAIFSLLGVTGTVLVGVSAFFLYLRKRAQELNKLFSDKLN